MFNILFAFRYFIHYYIYIWYLLLYFILISLSACNIKCIFISRFLQCNCAGAIYRLAFVVESLVYMFTHQMYLFSASSSLPTTCFSIFTFTFLINNQAFSLLLNSSVRSWILLSFFICLMVITHSHLDYIVFKISSFILWFLFFLFNTFLSFIFPFTLFVLYFDLFGERLGIASLF